MGLVLAQQERFPAEKGMGSPNFIGSWNSMLEGTWRIIWSSLYVPASASWHQVGTGDLGLQGKPRHRDGEPQVRGIEVGIGRREARGGRREVLGGADGAEGAAGGVRREIIIARSRAWQCQVHALGPSS